MAKKIFHVSLFTGMAFLWGMLICSSLILKGVNLYPINIQLVGTICAYGMVPCTIIAYAAGFYHFFIKDFIPMRKFEGL